jgi:hypothetical protein
LQQQTRWYLAFNEQTGSLTAVGEQLLSRLREVYEEYDRKLEAEQGAIPLPSNPRTITPASFYGEEQRTTQLGAGEHSQVRVRGQGRTSRSQRGRGERASRGSGRRRGRPSRVAA